jgi:uncharacterized membrane protein
MKDFFKSPFNITMIGVFITGIVLMMMNAIAPILLPIGLDVFAIGMFMWANNIYNANRERKDMDEVTGIKQSLDARKISEECLGKYFPNTAMLAAIVKVSKVMTDEELLNDMKGSFKHKFAKKPEVIEGNMKALDMALKEVEQI